MMALEIWRKPEVSASPGCVSLKIVGGPKDYLRIWDDGTVEWGWTLHESATLVWSDGWPADGVGLPDWARS